MFIINKLCCSERLRRPLARNIIHVLLALLLAVCFGNCSFVFIFAKYELNVWRNLPYIVAAFGLHMAFWWAMLNGVRVSALFAYTIFPLTICTQYAVYYGATRYGAVCEEFAVAAYNATWQQVGNYLNPRSSVLFIAIIGALVLMIVSFRALYKIRGFGRARWCAAVVSLLVGVAAFSLPTIVLHVNPRVAEVAVSPMLEATPHLLTYPIRRTREEALHAIIFPENPDDDNDYYYSIYQPIRSAERFYMALWDFHHPPHLDNAADAPSAVLWEKLPDTVVFYIGESFRADHNPMNGYHRNTLPQISQMPNIINFPNMHCMETQTISSIYSFLVYQDAQGKPIKTSFLDILTKHGFRSYLMVGTNSGRWYDTPLIAPLFVGRMALYSRPSSPAGYVADISALRSQSQDPLFIMIEDGAGHMPYHSTTHPFGTATNVDRSDNAMVDIDTTVSAVIRAIQHEEAILFFTSDHGESFGENGRWGHGGPRSAKEQMHVSAFMWYSDTYARKHPEIVHALRQNAARFCSLNQVYHSILSLCGISSALQIPAMDITKCEPYPESAADLPVSSAPAKAVK